ncbi:hypothetical protein V2K22_05950 [Pseudomonas alliivorans]|nr:hypothetical protein [Pseudomonas alliivorans]
MTAEENRSASNLVILCVEHALEVDQPNRADFFSTLMLRDWKQKQLNEFDALGRQGWMLTPEMTAEVLTASEKGITVSNSTLHLGGLGGNGPGAGGGGGGAIGKNARAGDGGNGGDIRHKGGIDSKDPLALALMSGQFPGAGGGGAGSDGEYSVGGGGGGGGERVEAVIPLQELERDHGPLSIQVFIGEGGRPGIYPGEQSGDGGDTTLKFVTGDGKTLRSIVAVGGRRGEPGFALPPEANEVTSAEIAAGLNVSTFMAAHSVHVQNSLLYVLGGGINKYSFPSLPDDVACWATVVVSMGQLPVSQILTFFVIANSPDGEEIFRLPFNPVKGEAIPAFNFIQLMPVQFQAQVAGVYDLRVVSGEYEFARMHIDVGVT